MRTAEEMIADFKKKYANVVEELLAVDLNDPELKKRAEERVNRPGFGTYTESLVVATQHEDWGE